MLIMITAPHFVAGVVTESRQGDGCGVVTMTAPIVHYMEGWSTDALTKYCCKKKWKVEVVG
jgi:hypothetical protein